MFVSVAFNRYQNSRMNMMIRAVTLFLFMCAGMPLAADELGVPENTVILTVSGDIAQTNVQQTARFDHDMLSALPATEFVTTTIWSEGPQTFVGVELKVILDFLGVDGGMLHATAINDYTVEIPVDDAVAGGPIIAYKLNGDVMSVRDKGPLWVIYPYDRSVDYRTEVVYSRSIWQLDRINVVN